MPITVETFEVEHFEKLVRGVNVAYEAYAALREELRKCDEDRDQVTQRLESAELALQEYPSADDWNRLVMFILDVERGLRSTGELFAFARQVDRS